jgi:hypothetical protein
MKKYTQRKVLIDTVLDEGGRHTGLNRLKSESSDKYRDRLRKVNSLYPISTMEYLNFNLSNRLNLEDRVVFNISLVENQIDLDDLPKIEVDAVYLKVWKNKSKDPVLTFNLIENKFMSSLKAELQQLNFLAIESADYDDELRCRNIVNSNTEGYREGVRFAPNGMHRLGEKYITSFISNNPIFTENSKASVEDLTDPGDYFLDKLNGILYTSQEFDGFGTFFYEKFPFELKWNSIKLYELNDRSIDYLIRDEVLVEPGVTERKALNSFGSMLINKTLEDTLIYWDK